MNEAEQIALAVDERRVRQPETWTDFSYLRWSKVENPKSRLGKVGTEKFLTESNMPKLNIITSFESASEISLDNLPDYFVLKPTSLWSGRGVMLLHRISGLGSYYDAKSGRILTAENVIEEAIKLEKSLQKSVRFMIEERAIDEDPQFIIPLDYKVFTFHGVTKFVLQVDRNHKIPRMSFFNGDFQPITDDRVSIPKDRRKKTAGVHRIPKCAQQILSLARDITVKLRATFISVDCYATQDGAIFGELTHTPGGPWYGSMYRFSEEFDLELGQEWKNAYERLGIPVPTIKSPYDIMLKGKKYRTIL